MDRWDSWDDALQALDPQDTNGRINGALEYARTDFYPDPRRTYDFDRNYDAYRRERERESLIAVTTKEVRKLTKTLQEGQNIEFNNYNKAIIVSGDGDFQCLAKYLHEQRKLEALLIPDHKKFSALLKFDIFKPYHRFVSDLRKKLEYTPKKKNPRKDGTLKGKTSILVNTNTLSVPL